MPEALGGQGGSLSPSLATSPEGSRLVACPARARTGEVLGYWLACVNLSEETQKFPEGLGGWADRPQGSLHPYLPPQLTSVTVDCSESCFRQALQHVSETPELKQESPCPSLCWTQAPGSQDMAPSPGPAPSSHNYYPLTFGAADVCGPLGKGSEKVVGLISSARGAGGECWGAGNADGQAATGVCLHPFSPIQAESARLLGVRRSLLPNSGVKRSGYFGLFGGSQSSLIPLRIC